MVRGTTAGLELVFAGRPFADAWMEIATRLAERPDFYRGSKATAIFDGDAPDDDAIATLVATVARHGIVLQGFYGSEAVGVAAARHDLGYLGEPPRPTVASFERKRAARDRASELTERARSLEPDFAGARADIANRRARGESSVAKPVFATPTAPVVAAAASPASPIAPVPASPATLYHRGTLRGGQALQQFGSIVVVGDVNPGAELVATGDIIVFGALRGTAHAGAQGDTAARVYALELQPTQLRIATFIAAGDGPRRERVPEVAFIDDDRIAIASNAIMGAK
jgi:septum site-determining protein MinC